MNLLSVSLPPWVRLKRRRKRKPRRRAFYFRRRHPLYRRLWASLDCPKQRVRQEEGGSISSADFDLAVPCSWFLLSFQPQGENTLVRLKVCYYSVQSSFVPMSLQSAVCSLSLVIRSQRLVTVSPNWSSERAVASWQVPFLDQFLSFSPQLLHHQCQGLRVDALLNQTHAN